MPFDSSGSLKVRTYTAGGALPLKNSVVRIMGVSEENVDSIYSLITDIDGVTKLVILPAPSALLSQTPGAILTPYALYNIEITAPGYYTKRIFNVAVFDGVESVQNVNMIPLPTSESDNIYPHGNLNTTVRENESLEQ
jgi:hypothetical protein